MWLVFDCEPCHLLQVLGLSIWTFKGPQSAKEAMVSAGTTVVELPDKLAASTSTWRHKANIWLPILMLYTPVHIFSCVVVSSFAVLPTQYAAAAWVGGLIVYYAVTAPGSPGHTGAHNIMLFLLFVCADLALQKACTYTSP